MEHSSHFIYPVYKFSGGSSSLRELVLHNDDVHSFDFVIDALVEICGHEPLQAEQCATLVDATGQCVVKSAPFDVVVVMCKELMERGLVCSIK
ncbi:MAG: ATP-dependent Clp protease adaptor ClpS [Flavobacteriales bacterium]|nr:ATP-dependent Clp protease adaptor ClpS [Flavobacteriales bacterium]